MKMKPLLANLVALAVTLPALAKDLSGTIKIDGSSTVFPITEAVAEEFQKSHPKVKVTVGISGTGGGFKKFTVGETDISDASRPISDKEREAAATNKIGYIELPIGYDGISVVVNPRNDFVDSLTVAELKKIWEPGSKVKLWSDVRPNWPKRSIRLYAPGTDSGTFDFFTEEVNGKAKACRSDFSPSENDNVLVQGIAGDPDSLGYFGFAYYEENRDRLKLVTIDSGKGPVAPSVKSIESGTYRPLSRPLFIYVNVNAVTSRPEVEEFVKFYLNNATKLIGAVGYVPFKAELYTLAMERLQKRMSGTVFGVLPPEKRVHIADLLKTKGQ
jgi:phosphate transport system substrate-binding protein